MPSILSRQNLFLATVLMLWAPGCASMQQMARRSQPAAATQQMEMQMNFAKAHEREGNYLKAETALREILAQNPNQANAKHRLGVTLVRSGKSDEGISYLEEAVQAMPHNLEARNDLGYSYMMRGDLDAAESLFREALEISPNHAKSINNLALTLGYQGQTKEAYSLFRQTMSEAEALANLGYIHSQRGEVDQSIQRYSQALSYDPTLRSAADGLIQVSNVREQALAAHQQREAEEASKTVQASHLEAPSATAGGKAPSPFVVE